MLESRLRVLARLNGANLRKYSKEDHKKVLSAPKIENFKSFLLSNAARKKVLSLRAKALLWDAENQKEIFRSPHVAIFPSLFVHDLSSV